MHCSFLSMWKAKGNAADAIGYKYMEVGRERGETGKYEFDFSGQRTRSILENYRLENLLYGFLHDVPVTLRAPPLSKVERVKASVRKMIRSGATMRKTQRRETHRACRRRRELRNGVRRQEKRDLYIPVLLPAFLYVLCIRSNDT